MTPPRNYPDSELTVHATSSVVGQLFRMVPRPEIVASLWYVLAATLESYPTVLLHDAGFMSNHWHMVLSASKGVLSKFIRDFNSLAGRQVNAVLGTSDKVFTGLHLTELLDESAVVEASSYALANPCAADLVDRACDWESVTTARMDYGEQRVCERPLVGLWTSRAPRPPKRRRKGRRGAKRAKYEGRSKLKDEYTLTLSRPRLIAQGSDGEARARVLGRLEEKENKHRERRRRHGRRVLGMAVVRSMSHDSVGPKRELFNTKRRFAGAKSLVVKAIAAYRSWVGEYRDALRRLRGGEVDVVFPHGTLRLRELGIVRVVNAPP